MQLLPKQLPVSSGGYATQLYVHCSSQRLRFSALSFAQLSTSNIFVQYQIDLPNLILLCAFAGHKAVGEGVNHSHQRMLASPSTVWKGSMGQMPKLFDNHQIACHWQHCSIAMEQLLRIHAIARLRCFANLRKSRSTLESSYISKNADGKVRHLPPPLLSATVQTWCLPAT